jgi:carboxypeptidase family protein
MHGRCIAFLCSAVLWIPLATTPVSAQDPPAAPQAQPAPQPPSSSSKGSKQKLSHAHDFLIRGTVFNDKAFAFPGAQLRIRRSGDKKFRWQDYTNSRGEFAIRVPQGSQYEMVVRAKGFAEQGKTIDATSGISDANVVFRMEPVKGGKK